MTRMFPLTALALALTTLFPASASATLVGDTVTAVFSGGQTVASPGSAEVGPGVEFNLGLPGSVNTSPIMTVDVGDGTVTFTSRQIFFLGSDRLDLGDLDWIGPPGRIVGFTILPGGQIPGLTESDVTFTDDSLSVNFSGIFLSGAGLSTTIELDVEHGIVPEPGSLGLLLLGGLLGLGWARRSAAA